MVVNNCCMDKQRRIDELEDRVRSRRVALGREQRKTEDGFFGSSTPSSKKPFKKATEKKEEKPIGLRPGHEGHGRKGHEAGTADRTEDIVSESETCPECGKLLLKKRREQRSV